MYRALRSIAGVPRFGLHASTWVTNPKRVTNPLQVGNLPHNGRTIHYCTPADGRER
jgi:hypothetical protein